MHADSRISLSRIPPDEGSSYLIFSGLQRWSVFSRGLHAGGTDEFMRFGRGCLLRFGYPFFRLKWMSISTAAFNLTWSSTIPFPTAPLCSVISLQIGATDGIDRQGAIRPRLGLDKSTLSRTYDSLVESRGMVGYTALLSSHPLYIPRYGEPVAGLAIRSKSLECPSGWRRWACLSRSF
jgi:hypothetical protein